MLDKQALQLSFDLLGFSTLHDFVDVFELPWLVLEFNLKKKTRNGISKEKTLAYDLSVKFREVEYFEYCNTPNVKCDQLTALRNTNLNIAQCRPQCCAIANNLTSILRKNRLTVWDCRLASRHRIISAWSGVRNEEKSSKSSSCTERRSRTCLKSCNNASRSSWVTMDFHVKSL